MNLELISEYAGTDSAQWETEPNENKSIYGKAFNECDVMVKKPSHATGPLIRFDNFKFNDSIYY